MLEEPLHDLGLFAPLRSVFEAERALREMLKRVWIARHGVDPLHGFRVADLD